jgi:hypothetical protein
MSVEVVFMELDPVWSADRDGKGWLTLGRWQGLLLQPAEDRESGRKVRKLPVIRETASGWYEWSTHGASGRPGGGTRHHSAHTLTEAQDQLTRWAKRRLTSVEPSLMIRS